MWLDLGSRTHSDGLCYHIFATADLDHNRQHLTNSFRGPIYLHGLTLIPVWISYHMPGNVWDEIIDPLPNFNGVTSRVYTVANQSYVLCNAIFRMESGRIVHSICYILVLVAEQNMSSSRTTVWLDKPASCKCNTDGVFYKKGFAKLALRWWNKYVNTSP